MARGGVYRSDVEKARNALLARGKHPSIDAVRDVLGTGSKTTIHRHLKDLEAESAGDPKARLSTALSDLVSQLADRLAAEANERVERLTADFETERQARKRELEERMQELASEKELRGRAEAAFNAERTAHEEAKQSFAEATATIRQMEERVDGLLARIAEHEAHAQSLEQKHAHAREALEHYRTAAKEQRDQEQRRHEHQIQELQAAIRQLTESQTAKNHELLQLNRDNARLTEQLNQQDKALHQSRAEAREQGHELAELRPLVGRLQALESRFAQEQEAVRVSRKQCATLGADIARERESRIQAEALASRLLSRLEAAEARIASGPAPTPAIEPDAGQAGASGKA